MCHITDFAILFSSVSILEVTPATKLSAKILTIKKHYTSCWSIYFFLSAFRFCFRTYSLPLPTGLFILICRKWYLHAVFSPLPRILLSNTQWLMVSTGNQPSATWLCWFMLLLYQD